MIILTQLGPKRAQTPRFSGSSAPRLTSGVWLHIIYHNSCFGGRYAVRKIDPAVGHDPLRPLRGRPLLARLYRTRSGGAAAEHLVRQRIGRRAELSRLHAVRFVRRPVQGGMRTPRRGPDRRADDPAARRGAPDARTSPAERRSASDGYLRHPARKPVPSVLLGRGEHVRYVRPRVRGGMGRRGVQNDLHARHSRSVAALFRDQGRQRQYHRL